MEKAKYPNVKQKWRFELVEEVEMSDLLIGTSGYDYPEWKGVFYPKDFLSYYAIQFNALELNNTFYNMPTAE